MKRTHCDFEVREGQWTHQCPNSGRIPLGRSMYCAKHHAIARAKAERIVVKSRAGHEATGGQST